MDDYEDDYDAELEQEDYDTRLEQVGCTCCNGCMDCLGMTMHDFL